MRIATWNVEWFDNLFDNRGLLHDDDRWSGRRDVTRADQAAAIAHVLRRIDADAVMVIEAPDTSRARDGTRALETFARVFSLRTRAAVMGFPNDTQQEITLLYDPDALSARHDPGGTAPGTAPPFDRELRIDLDIDGRLDTVTWSKPPLELAITPRDAPPFRMIGVHTKSKAPHGARGHAEITRLSIENRRKQLAQCIWLRMRASEHLDAGDSLILLGDLNDGPGLDEYEKLFRRSGVEIVLGNGDEIPLYDPHADLAFHAHAAHPPVTARFARPRGHGHIEALLDFIMVSPDLRARGPHWRIWHPLHDPAIRAEPLLSDALLVASDHFPVTLDFAPGNPHLPSSEP
jgi:hypothetical protein